MMPPTKETTARYGVVGVPLFSLSGPEFSANLYPAHSTLVTAPVEDRSPRLTIWCSACKDCHHYYVEESVTHLLAFCRIVVRTHEHYRPNCGAISAQFDPEVLFGVKGAPPSAYRLLVSPYIPVRFPPTSPRWDEEEYQNYGMGG